jgi:hypothetical protein
LERAWQRITGVGVGAANDMPEIAKPLADAEAAVF